MVIWLIGKSGVGKTTVANEIIKKLRKDKKYCVLLDGDIVRSVFGAEAAEDYSVEGRKKNILRLQRLCKFLEEQDIIVVCATLCIFPSVLYDNRSIFSSYFEVYLTASKECLVARDPKGFYALAEAGQIDNFVGYDIEFPEPLDADLVVSTESENTEASIAGDIINKMYETL